MNKYNIFYKKLNWYNPEQIFPALFADKKYTFWLDNNPMQSIRHPSSANRDRFSYMGIASKTVKYIISNHTLSVSNNGNHPTGGEKLNLDILTYLQSEIRNPKYEIRNTPFDFTGGFIGYFGYEMDAHFFFVDKFLAFDHRQKCLYLVCLSEEKKEAKKWFSSIKRQLSKILVIARSAAIAGDEAIPLKYEIAALPSVARNDKIKPPAFAFSVNRDKYLKNIRTCQKYLLKGDVYQICLTNQITANIKADWIKLFLTLRRINPTPTGAYINFGNFALISSSPEQFLRVDKKGCVTSRPMKGTIRRGDTRGKDIILAKNLGKTKKDYAENIMIADLIRNDLGKICEFGSIKVIKPLEVQTYATVHQLVSTIKGKLRPEATIIDLLKAAFPGGSMTGAPKIRAMEIIAELEKTPRGVYSGAFGFISLNGTANLAMTIRTIIANKDRLSFGAGGAILTDSVPEEEYEEMLLKAQPLMDAIKKS